jgi:HK97 family phage portal protein
MSFLDRIRNAFRAEQPEIAPIETKEPSLAFPSSSMLYSLGLWPSATGVPTSPIQSLQVSAVYACVKRLSEDLGKLPIQIRKKSSKGGWKVDTTHPLNKLFRSPNSWQTQFGLIQHLIVSLQMRGNGYIYIARDRDGDAKQLIPIMPDRLSILLSEDGNVYYNITSQQFGANTIIATTEDLIHVRNLSLDGGIRGVSPISCSQDSFGVAVASQRHAALFFRQGTNLSGVLEAPARLSEEAAKRMAQSWQAAYSGSDNHHKIAVLEEGVKYNSNMSVSPNDAQLLETQKFSAEQIARIFGVPPWLIGLPVPVSTYSNVEQSQLTYVTNTLSGLAKNVEDEFERVLLFEDEQDRYQIQFDFDSMLRGDLKSRMEAAQIQLLNGVCSINEIREREGLEAIQNGDEHRVPLNTSSAAGKPSDTAPEGNVAATQPNEIPA